MKRYGGKSEVAFIRSSMKKTEKQYQKDKAELLRALAASGMDWAWGIPTRPRANGEGWEYIC